MKVVIMAGGKGTRIASVNSEVPKPMIEIGGKPILQWQIENLKACGLTEIILVVGYMGKVIQDYFKDGTSFGVHISYFVESTPLGTAGALFKMSHYDSSLLVTKVLSPQELGGLPIDTHCVVQWMNKEDERSYYKNRVNAGIEIISPVLLQETMRNYVPRHPENPDKIDLDRDVLKPNIQSGRIYAYDTPEYIKDMGTPDRYYEVESDILSGKVKARNLINKQKAVFLDRDGTINQYVGFLTKPEQFELIPEVPAAIKLINKSGYLAIVVTNQPVIARGDCTWEGLQMIHDKMEMVSMYALIIRIRGLRANDQNIRLLVTVGSQAPD